MALLIVQNDTEWITAVKEGRFSIETDAALSEPHLMAAVKEMQERMIEGLRKVGWHYVEGGEKGFDLVGPLPHIVISDDVDADPGLVSPDPRETEKFDRWERAEKARTAKRRGEVVDRVDFVLRARFKRRLPTSFHFR
jgi:hypothetical protein